MPKDEEPEVVEDLPSEPKGGVQITKKWVTRGSSRKGKHARNAPRTGGRVKEILERIGDAAYVGVVETVKNADPQDARSPVFVLNHDIVPVSVLHESGIEAFKEQIAQEHGDGSYALRFLAGSNFTGRLRDPETGDPLPDVPFLVGRIKVGLPEDREADFRGDPRDDYADIEQDDINEASRELYVERLKQRIKRLKEEGQPARSSEGQLVPLLIPILTEALKPKPSFEIEAVKAIFQAQRDASAEMQKTLFASMGEMMRQMVKFRIDDMRQERGIEDDPFEGAPWAVKAGASVIEKIAGSPVGQILAEKIGGAVGQSGRRSPHLAQPPSAAALPPGNDAAKRHAALTRMFRMITESVELRPDPGVLVDRHLKGAFGMLAEVDRTEILGAIRKLRGGDFSGMEHLFSYLRSARVPGVQEFAVRLGQDAISPQWVKDVLLELLAIHEPEAEPAQAQPPAEPQPNGGEATTLRATTEEIVQEEVVE